MQMANGSFACCVFIGELQHITKLKPWPLEQVLVQKYDYPPRQAKALKDFLVLPLALDPSNRPSAKALSDHPWFDMDDSAPPYPTANRFHHWSGSSSSTPVPPGTTAGSSGSDEASPSGGVITSGRLTSSSSIAALD